MRRIGSRLRGDGSGRRPLSLMAAVALAAAAALASCSGGSSPSSDSTPLPVGSPTTLKVMEFNIEYGGTQVSFAKVAAAVKAADPDVVGIEEAETNTVRLARAVGFTYADPGMQIISRYPILEPSGAGGAYALIEVQPGKAVALTNVHLPSAPYSPWYMVTKGWGARQVVKLERRVRLPAIAGQLDVLPALARRGMPVFLVGDFNSASSLDYTQAAVGSRSEVKEPIDWPVSHALLAAGFRDSYREAHPDPVAVPGLTWPAVRPKVSGWNPNKASGEDRIDFIYVAGAAGTVASTIVGENGARDVTTSVSPWPSDHRAVLSTFRVRPAALPVMVAVDAPLVSTGTPIRVTYRRPASGGCSVALVPIPAATAVSPSPVATSPATATDGVVSFATDALAPGAYEVVLKDASSTLARTPVWVKAAGAGVRLTTDRTTYTSGQPITVSWQDAPANRWDWIGVYKASAADPNVDYYLVWQYTGGAMAGTVHGLPAGSMTMTKDTVEGSPWPLPPGRYVVYYLLADAYRQVAMAHFTVTK